MRRLAVLVSALALPAASPPTAPLQPAGKWVVNFDAAQCLAEREYGTPGDPLRLVLKQPAAGSIIQVAMVAKGGSIEPSQIDGSIGFDSQTRTKMSALHFRPGTAKYGVHLMNVPQDVVTGARYARVLHLRTGTVDRSFALTNMSDLLKIMDQCVMDLKRVWNIASDESDRELQGPPRPGGVRGLFKDDDYPGLAIDDDESGTTRIAVLVDEQGRVADCSVVGTSGVAILDSQSCAVVRERARFKPALGASGKPIKSGFVQRITWRME